MTTKTSAGVPISDGFDFPVGPRGDQVNVFETHKVDTTLVDPDYYESFKVWHPGEDWNGRGGGDTDLGDPIYASSHGRVVEFGYYPPSWGNLVLLEHALPDGTRVWSQYAHLEQIMVSQVGQNVSRGQQIGTMGKGAKTDNYPQGRWVAHLHFEIRRDELSIGNWTPMVQDKEAVLAHYYSPTEFIKAHRPGSLAIPVEIPVFTEPEAPAPLQVVIDTQQSNPRAGTFRRTQNGEWYQSPDGYQGDMLWTIVSDQQESDWGEWRPLLPVTGNWQVWVFIPANNATSTYARYRVSHLDGLTEIPVNQWGNRNRWVDLGTFRFDERGGHVRLGNFSGELGLPLALGFDTICWSQAG
jgi:murein DD-endopeptidase MepM/ murein hydrolase activator NlpD